MWGKAGLEVSDVFRDKSGSKGENMKGEITCIYLRQGVFIF